MLRCLFLAILIIALIHTASAIPKYAQDTGEDCITCHSNPATGELNDLGKAFKATHKWPPEQVVKSEYFFITGFLHLFSVVLWIGAIFFVHLVHTPDIVAMGGAPRRELVLGWMGIFGTGVSGAILTLFRFQSLYNLINSETGRIVLIKISIYLFMVFTAITLTIHLNRKFRMSNVLPLKLDVSNLERFDKLEKCDRVLVSVGGLVFDLSESQMWKNGKHIGKHEAWRDLTNDIKESPHGIGVLMKYRPVGYTSEFLKIMKDINRATKIFRFFAYTNLILGIAAIALSSYMRWIL